MKDYIKVFSRQAVQMDSLISEFIKDINEGLYLGVLKASSSDGCPYLRVCGRYKTESCSIQERDGLNDS